MAPVERLDPSSLSSDEAEGLPEVRVGAESDERKFPEVMSTFKPPPAVMPSDDVLLPKLSRDVTKTVDGPSGDPELSDTSGMFAVVRSPSSVLGGGGAVTVISTIEVATRLEEGEAVTGSGPTVSVDPGHDSSG